jgi:hypothetical protein
MKKNLLQTTFVVITLIFAASAIPAQSKAPKTVRDFFMLMPSKYFSLDCCMEKTPKASKEKYLSQYLDVEDTANGYMKGYGDGAQEAFQMALFKKADGSYLIGFYTIGEGDVEDYPWTVFLQYRPGRWTDVSKTAVPGYSPKKLIYELPRKGTTVEVFQKDETASDFSKGKKLYELVWKNGKFTKKV